MSKLEHKEIAEDLDGIKELNFGELINKYKYIHDVIYLMDISGEYPRLLHDIENYICFKIPSITRFKEVLEKTKKDVDTYNAASRVEKAHLLMNGIGVRKNQSEAFKIFVQYSQYYEVAQCYLEGCGVAKNYDKYIENLRAAAIQGSLPALREAITLKDFDDDFKDDCYRRLFRDESYTKSISKDVVEYFKIPDGVDPSFILFLANEYMRKVSRYLFKGQWPNDYGERINSIITEGANSLDWETFKRYSKGEVPKQLRDYVMQRISPIVLDMLNDPSHCSLGLGLIIELVIPFGKNLHLYPTIIRHHRNKLDNVTAVYWTNLFNRLSS